MTKEDLIEQLQKGGQNNTYSRDDLFTILDTLDDTPDHNYMLNRVYDVLKSKERYKERTISCIVVEGKAKSKYTLLTFLASDFQVIRNDELWLNTDHKPLHLAYSQLESVILQLNGAKVVDIEALQKECNKANADGYYNKH